MKNGKHETKPDSRKAWQSTQYSNLIRYVPSGVYYARFRVRGKLIWKSLKTTRITVAQMRLADLEKGERVKAERGHMETDGRILFAQAIAAYRASGFRPAVPRTRKDVRPLKPAAVAYYQQRLDALEKSWPQLPNLEIRQVSEKDCVTWADKVRAVWSPTVFNHTLGILRNIIEFGIKAGARYDNPAKAIMRESERSKVLELPSAEKFAELLAEIENGGSRFSRPCADLVRFLAFGGFRKSEAAFIRWSDCDFARSQIVVRGHPETGLKNRVPGEIRVVPMIPEMRTLLRRIRSERPNESADSLVMQVRECQKAIDRAARNVGIKRLTHHDLRHLFATRCIESGVDIPTVSRWLGHRDGGALCMKVYGHLRDQHSTEMARKVMFTAQTGEEKR